MVLPKTAKELYQAMVLSRKHLTTFILDSLANAEG